MTRFVMSLIVSLGLAGPVFATQQLFDGSWREQGFLRFWSNEFRQLGGELEVISDGTVSLLWRAVTEQDRDARQASWTWTVREGVPATDLTRKGGDDRNLAIYFVFTDPGTAEGLTGASARRLLRQDNTRALVYVWGGAEAAGTMLPSPYHPRLKTVVRRPAGTGMFPESVDLVQDHRRAFGLEKQVLVGIGVTADSDDTDGRIVARIEDLRLN